MWKEQQVCKVLALPTVTMYVSLLKAIDDHCAVVDHNNYYHAIQILQEEGLHLIIALPTTRLLSGQTVGIPPLSPFASMALLLNKMRLFS